MILATPYSSPNSLPQRIVEPLSAFAKKIVSVKRRILLPQPVSELERGITHENERPTLEDFIVLPECTLTKATTQLFVARTRGAATTNVVCKINKKKIDYMSFKREAAILQWMWQEKIPHIIPLLHAFDVIMPPGDLHCMLVFPHQGKTLHHMLGEGFKFSWPSIKLFALSLFEILEKLHKLNLVYCDLSNNNVLVDPKGNLTVIDFGSCSPLPVCTHRLPTTQRYSAPEVLCGHDEVTTSLDVWSAACLIYEIIVGKPLFPSTTIKEHLMAIAKIAGEPPQNFIDKANFDFEWEDSCFATTIDWQIEIVAALNPQGSEGNLGERVDKMITLIKGCLAWEDRLTASEACKLLEDMHFLPESTIKVIVS